MSEALPIGAYVTHMYRAVFETPFSLHDHWHILLDVGFILFIVYLLTRKSYKRGRSDDKLTENEIRQLVDEWRPEPLCPPDANPAEAANVMGPLIDRYDGKTITYNGRTLANFGAFNFLGLAGNKEIVEEAHKAVRHYGVGSCGPRGFYGTIDVHLQLEDRLARFLGAEECVLYSYEFSTTSCVIPCYSKRDDLIICDKGVSASPLVGVYLSRSHVQWADHNNLAQMEKLMQDAVAEDRKKGLKTPTQRRFVVVEGVYQDYADVCPLDQLVALAKKYCFRIILDDSFGFGVLGATGRGTPEHFGVSIKDIELYCVGMGSSLSTIGGFCVGDHTTVDHQRLSSSGYCFSASLPPLFASAAIKGLDLIENQPALRKRLLDNVAIGRKALENIPGTIVHQSPLSPIIHIRLTDKSKPRLDQDAILQRIVDLAATEVNLSITRAKHTSTKVFPKLDWTPQPSVRIAFSAAFSTDEVTEKLTKLREIVTRVVSQSSK